MDKENHPELQESEYNAKAKTIKRFVSGKSNSPPPGRIITIAGNASTTFFLTTTGLYKSKSYFKKEEPTPIGWELVQKLIGQKILKVVVGDKHMLALVQGGRVYSWGDNTYGQLGLGDTLQPCESPKVIEALGAVVIKDIFVGGNSSFCLTEDGNVYALGANPLGQLGLEETTNKQTIPRWITHLKEPISEMSCSSDHTLFLSEAGKIYSCGSNSFGKLGLTAKYFRQKQIFLPTQLTTLPAKIKKVAAGKHHFLCLTHNGTLYGFGSNQFNQLNLDEHIELTATPLPIKFSHELSQIAASENYSLCLDSQGNLYSFGTNTGGVLGHSVESTTKIITLSSQPLTPLRNYSNNAVT